MARCGLKNSGNECFMNATLQCLSVSPFIQNFITRYKNEDIKLFQVITKFELGKYKADNIKIECDRILTTQTETLSADEKRILLHLLKNSANIYIYIAFKDLIRNLTIKKGKLLTAGSFISIIQELTEGSGFEHLFSGEQNDPHEFMAYLLDIIHKSKSTQVVIDHPANIDNLDISFKLYLNHFKARYENDYSYFVKNLYFYILNCVECSECKNKTYDLCPSYIMCVSIPYQQASDITLHDCLDEMFKVEDIEYKCEIATCCNTQGNRIEKKILSKPKTLMIKIKRYTQTPQNRLIKINKMVHYPEVLSMQQYFCGEQINDYELYAIINHTGSLQGGHYYSFIKTLKEDGTGFDDQWICCNDSQTSFITEEEALSSSNSYILFYTMIA